MKFCPRCGTQLEDTATTCPSCNMDLTASYAPANNYDHTSEYDPADISDNKVFAMCVYLLGTAGVIIALLASRDSAYTAFHVRQGLKLTIVTMIVAIITAVLCWTVIVPIIGGVCACIIMVLSIICFFQICAGKAVEPAIIRSLGFLK